MTLWFRQPLGDTLWLLAHVRYHPTPYRRFARILTGRCAYCGRRGCLD